MVKIKVKEKKYSDKTMTELIYSIAEIFRNLDDRMADGAKYSEINKTLRGCGIELEII